MKYNTSEKYQTSRQAEKAARLLRPLRPGDSITVNGLTRKIRKAMYSDIFIEYAKEWYVIYFICEFIAEDGGYGYYKSYFDGGVIELMD